MTSLLNLRWACHCLAVVALLAYNILQSLTIWIVAVCFLTALIITIKAQIKHHDPYDLNKLRDLHEQEDDLFEEPEINEDVEQVLCPHCFTTYQASKKACPACKKPNW